MNIVKGDEKPREVTELQVRVQVNWGTRTGSSLLQSNGRAGTHRSSGQD